LIFIGFILSAIVVILAFRIGALTRSGAIAAWIVGGVVCGVGGWLWAAALLTFFATSSGLSRWRKRRKESLGYEKGGRRDAGQVLANGGAATVCALLPILFPVVGKTQAFFWFLSALAAANADTWATEIGSALGGRPIDLRTGRLVTPGTSGAISLGGMLAALAGAALIGVFAPEGISRSVVIVAGWGGAIGDSLMGAFVQAQWRDPEEPERWIERPQSRSPDRGWRWVGNDAVNFMASLLAICLAVMIKK